MTMDLSKDGGVTWQPLQKFRSMGAAGKLDPTAVDVADLYQTHTDPLARALRKQLRRRYDWPEVSPKRHTIESGVKVVYSRESRRMPLPPGWDGEDGLQNVAAFLQAQGIPPPTPAAGRGAK